MEAKRPRPPQSSPATHAYLLVVCQGLEPEALREVHLRLAAWGEPELELLPEPEAPVLGHANVGLILLRTAAPPEAVTALPATSIMALISHRVDCPDGPREDVLALLQRDLREAPLFEPALAVLARHVGEDAVPDPPTFRVSSLRGSKRHTFSSHDLMVAGGDGVTARFPSWAVNMTEYHVNVFVIAKGNVLATGLLLDTALYPTHSSRLEGCRRVFTRSFSKDHVNLRESTAHLLQSMAHVRPGDLVVDPFGGIGTLPLMATGSGQRAFGLTGEINDELLPLAGANAVGRPVDALQWDAGRLPLRDGCVDVIISDMPFGVRCNKTSLLKKLMPKFLAEVVRVTRPGARIVLLAIVSKAFRALWEGDYSLAALRGVVELKERRSVDIVGIQCDVFVAERL